MGSVTIGSHDFVGIGGITRMLKASGTGDQTTLDRLVPAVYGSCVAWRAVTGERSVGESVVAARTANLEWPVCRGYSLNPTVRTARLFFTLPHSHSRNPTFSVPDRSTLGDYTGSIAVIEAKTIWAHGIDGE